MAFITRYGSMWGAIPQTSGRIFWVAPASAYTVEGRAYTAADGNDGLSPERAFLTLDNAINNTTASTGDVIVLLPGTHSWAASAAADVAGITIMGLPCGAGNFLRQRASITTSAADEIINVTAADVEIAYLHVIPVTAQRGIDFTTAADRLHVHHCSFDMFTPVVSTSTIGVGVTAVGQLPKGVIVDNCSFQSDGAQGVGVALGDTIQGLIEWNTFLLSAGSWAAACGFEGVTSQTGLIRYNDFMANQATMTIGIIGGTDDGTSGRMFIHDNRFNNEVTTPIDNWGVQNASICENYRGAVGIAAGGVLWSSIT